MFRVGLNIAESIERVRNIDRVTAHEQKDKYEQIADYRSESNGLHREMSTRLHLSYITIIPANEVHTS